MGYYIKKSSALASVGDVFWTGGTNWSDNNADKKVYANQSTANSKIVNTDGKNGGFAGASVVSA